jgi:hypothetical protein
MPNLVPMAGPRLTDVLTATLSRTSCFAPIIRLYMTCGSPLIALPTANLTSQVKVTDPRRFKIPGWIRMSRRCLSGSKTRLRLEV